MCIRDRDESKKLEWRGTPEHPKTVNERLTHALVHGITDFITDQYEGDPEGLERGKKVFNTIGDKVETVTPWLADKVLSNDKSGAAIEWLTTTKLLTRFALAPFRRRDLFS